MQMSKKYLQHRIDGEVDGLAEVARQAEANATAPHRKTGSIGDLFLYATAARISPPIRQRLIRAIAEIAERKQQAQTPEGWWIEPYWVQKKRASGTRRYRYYRLTNGETVRHVSVKQEEEAIAAYRNRQSIDRLAKEVRRLAESIEDEEEARTALKILENLLN